MAVPHTGHKGIFLDTISALMKLSLVRKTMLSRQRALQALNPAWRVLCPLHRWVNHKFFTCVLWTYEFKTYRVFLPGPPPNIILPHDYLGYLGNDFKNSSQLPPTPLLSGGSRGGEGVQNFLCKIQRIMPIHDSFSTVPKYEKLWKSEGFFFFKELICPNLPWSELIWWQNLNRWWEAVYDPYFFSFGVTSHVLLQKREWVWLWCVESPNLNSIIHLAPSVLEKDCVLCNKHLYSYHENWKF